MNHFKEFNASKLSFTLQKCTNFFHDFSKFNITYGNEIKIENSVSQNFLKIESILLENLEHSQNRVST